MPRPSPGLERHQRLARALALSAINASPEPRPREQSTPRLNLGLERNQRLARTSPSVPDFSHTAAVPPDTTRVIPPTPRQDTSPTISTTLIPVTPYPCHCEYVTTVRGMGGINSHHCCHILAITVPLLQDEVQGFGSDDHDPNRVRRHH